MNGVSVITRVLGAWGRSNEVCPSTEVLGGGHTRPKVKCYAMRNYCLNQFVTKKVVTCYFWLIQQTFYQ